MSTIEMRGDRKTAIDAYIDLDLGAESAAASDLYRRAEREAALPEIALTGDGDAGSVCGNLTPSMMGWLAEHVLRARQNALSVVESLAAQVRLTGGVQGMVGEIEEDRLRRVRNQRRTEEIKRFYERHHSKLTALDEVEQEYLALKVYEGGRDATVPSPLIDFGVPAVIMIPEFFMNYISFMKLSGVPAIGFGSSLVVALAIAVSAYMSGTFFKAYSFYMNSDREERKSKGLRHIGIAAFLLLVSLGAVAYARYHMVLEQREAAQVIGLPLPNIAALTLGLLAGNLLVFSVGAAVTFMMHDDNPEFARKAAKFRKLEAQVNQLRRKQLLASQQSIENRYRQDLDRTRGIARLMDAQPDSHRIVEAMSHIASKDAQVIGLLNTYRMLLVEHLTDRDPYFVFKGPVTDRYSGQGGERVSLADFGALPLELYRSN